MRATYLTLSESRTMTAQKRNAQLFEKRGKET